MDVSKIMSRRLVTVSARSDLLPAMDLMIESGISGLMVLNDAGTLCGILSEGDLLRRIELGTAPPTKAWWSTVFASMDLAAAYRIAHGRTVSDVMTANPITIDASSTLTEAADLMETHRIKRIPVMSAGKLVGVVSRINFVKALRAVGRKTKARNAGDEAIKEHIVDELRHQPWTFGCSIDVVVDNGHVTLDGSVTSESQKGAAQAAAQVADGARSVENLLKVYDKPIAEPA